MPALHAQKLAEVSLKKHPTLKKLPKAGLSFALGNFYLKCLNPNPTCSNQGNHLLPRLQ